MTTKQHAATQLQMIPLEQIAVWGRSLERAQAFAASIGDVFPDAAVSPYVMLQASDSRHFAAISENVYRFLPFDLRQDELQSIHGVDERIREAYPPTTAP